MSRPTSGSVSGSISRAMVRAAGARRFLRVGHGDVWSRDQVALVAVHVVSVWVFLSCMRAAGGSVDGWGLGFAVFGALAMARWPETPIPLAGWGALLVWWVVTVTSRFTWWALPAAVALLIAHTALALSALCPRDGRLTGALLLRTGRRLVVVAAMVGVVALGCAVVYAAQPPGYSLIAGGALLLLAGWVWLVGSDQDGN